MPPTFADMKQENIGLQENIDELKADKKNSKQRKSCLSVSIWFVLQNNSVLILLNYFYCHLLQMCKD